MIKNLAIKGGGVKGVAYVGAIRELEKANILSNIQRVSGTSAGAMMACMLCCGYSVAEIEKLMREIRFTKFKNGWNPFRVLSNYGLYNGSYVIDYVKMLLKGSPKGLQEDCTFLDMRKAGCKDLFVFACNTSMHDVREFSADETPNVKVKEAVRASMSIPFFFKAWKFTEEDPDDHIYVDGGLVYNYPLSFFDADRFNKMENVNYESIGLYLYSSPMPQKIEFKFFQPLFFVKQIFESLIATQDYMVMQDREQVQRSVMINDLSIPSTYFKISSEQCDALIESGAQGARDFIIKYLPLVLATK